MCATSAPRDMWRLIFVVAVLAACGKKDKPADKGSAAPVAQVVSDAAPAPVVDAAPAPLTGPGYELAEAAATVPPAGSLVGKDPPTAESLHLELSYALAKWAANPRDKTLYTKDFGGRDEPDGRIDLVGYDEWMKKLPARPAQMANPAIKT